VFFVNLNVIQINHGDNIDKSFCFRNSSRQREVYFLAAILVPFPVKPDNNLTELDKIIRKWLAELSADPDLIHHVAERMISFIDNYASKTFEPTFNLPVPEHTSKQEAEALLAAIDKGMQATGEEVLEMINKIIVERFFLEIQLYELETKQKKLDQRQITRLPLP
jgi:hypothetical protein